MTLTAPHLEQRAFTQLRAHLHEACGISLNDHETELVRSRLLRRLRTLGLTSFDAYIARLEADRSGEERKILIDSLTTNTTHFFREPHHFDTLAQLLSERPDARVWSAGCSSGQEPYSIAIAAIELGARPRILATDISTKVLANAREGIYAEDEIAAVPRSSGRHFEPAGAGRLRVAREVASLVRFARLNLLERWPMRGPFQAIFCRNVMIYFERALQHALVARFRALPSSMARSWRRFLFTRSARGWSDTTEAWDEIRDRDGDASERQRRAR